MFTQVRYFIKTSILFLVLGLIAGLYMSIAQIVGWPYGYSLVLAHTHVILIGSVMMMIMGVALWFFPRPTKEDKRYKPEVIRVLYWVMTVSTVGRFFVEAYDGLRPFGMRNMLVLISGALQVFCMVGFFYMIWGRIRPVGSQFREAQGEKF